MASHIWQTLYTDDGMSAHERKVAEQNEKDLLFESADTWQHMEVPE